MRRPVLRRVLAALLAALAVGGTVYAALDRGSPDGVAVLVAARQVPVGAVLSAGDVAVREVPPHLLPTGALSDPAGAVGLPVASVLSEGEVLTAHDVRTGSLLQGQADGSNAVWLPVPGTAVAEALAAGDRVDVHSPVDGTRVVEDVLVLAVRSGSAGPSGLMGTTGSTGAETGAWLALSPAQTTALAGARGADPAGGALLLALHPVPGGG